MEQDPRLRQMSREENAAYRGVTVDESGAEPQDDASRAAKHTAEARAPLCAMSVSAEQHHGRPC